MTHLFRPAFGLMVCGAFVWALGAPTSANAGFFGWFGSSGGSSGGSWGSYGSSGGSWGSYGSSGGSYGSYGSSGGSWGSYGSSGGWYGSSGGSSGGYYHHDSHHEDNGHEGDAARKSSDTRVARVVVKVPENAKVYLQDQPMSLSGKVRKFVSPKLDPKREYEYTVRVELDRDGQTLTKTATARVKAGQRVEVSVNFAENNPHELVASIERQ
jgi:uncharacterized protein (TIGR03000 family)